MEEVKVKQKKKFGIPHVYFILFMIILVSTALTWIIPAGSYGKDAAGNTVYSAESFINYGVTQNLGPWKMFLSIVDGFASAQNVIFMIFCCYAGLFVLQETGAMDAAIAGCVRTVKRKPALAPVIMAIIMTLLSLWGTTGTLSFEEIIAFIPIFCTLSMALGYDPMVGVSISILSVGYGFSVGVWNPFTTGTAQSIAGVGMFSGTGYRLVMLVVMTAVLITYTLVYAARVKKDPVKSVTYGTDFSSMRFDETKIDCKFDRKKILSMLCLLVIVVIMGYGLGFLGWYIEEITALFVILPILLGIVNLWHPNKVCTTWVTGLGKAALPAMAVGLARGILFIMGYGGIVHPIINWASSLLNTLGAFGGSIGLLFLQTIINLFIPSGSGQAVVTMPIMSPIASIIGVSQQVCVSAFTFGDGFSNMLWPTAAGLVATMFAGIPVGKYYKWFLPLYGITFVFMCLFLCVGVAIGW